MKKLIVNPKEFDEASIKAEYDETIKDSDYAKDITILIKDCERHGFELEPLHAFYAWSEFSADRHAGWLEVYETPFESIKPYLIEVQS